MKTPEGELAWLGPWQAFSQGEKSLALPFGGQREGPRYSGLTVAGPMTRLTIVPGLIEETLYLPFVEFGRDHLPGFMVFAYDWRHDIRQSADELCARLESLGPRARVRIIAHSMGGLITLQCLRHGSPAARERVTHVVFAGTPFKGAAGPWDDLFLGTNTVRNKSLLTAEALLTFSSVWQLMPPQADFFVNAQREPVEVDAFSKSAWLEKGWGVFRDASLKDNPAYTQQLEQRLEARLVWEGLQDEPDSPEPTWKTLVIVGTGRPTTAGWVVKADGTFDFEAAVTADGDGTVLTSRATPPSPIHGALVHTEAEHAVLLNEPGVQSVIGEFVKAR